MTAGLAVRLVRKGVSMGMIRRRSRVTAGALVALLLALGAASEAHAAPAIDPDQDGSITIHKLQRAAREGKVCAWTICPA